MSIKNRINAIEKKTGLTSGPVVVLLRNVDYEPGSGTAEFKKASVIFGPNAANPFDVKMHEGETGEAFQERVQAEWQPRLTIDSMGRKEASDADD